MNKETILGFDICNATYSELINCIFNDFDNDITNFIVNINPEIIISNYKDKHTIDLFNMQKYQIPDGIGIIYGGSHNVAEKAKTELEKSYPGIKIVRNL